MAFAFLGCAQKSSKTAENPEAFTADQLYQKTLKAHGNDSFLSNKINFKIKDASYECFIDQGRYNFEMKREVNNVQNKLTYTGGYIEYRRNDTIQNIDGTRYSIVEKSIFGFPFTYFAPFTLNTNDITLTTLPDATIRSSHYYSLKATFAPEGDNTTGDEIIMYINQESYVVTYFALNFNKISSDKLLFKRNTNFRHVDGILFYDYDLFVENNPDGLNELYQKYNNASLEHLGPVEIVNPILTPLTD